MGYYIVRVSRVQITSEPGCPTLSSHASELHGFAQVTHGINKEANDQHKLLDSMVGVAGWGGLSSRRLGA